MKQRATFKVLLAVIFISIVGIFGYQFWKDSEQKSPNIAEATPEELVKRLQESLSQSETEDGKKRGRFNKPRYEYMFKLLRDPATNSIPVGIREREISYARTLPTFRQVKSKMKGKAAQVEGFNWISAGPTDVGGRTRALGIDPRNTDIIITGGVSGGIWKSIDGGETWEMKTPEIENLSVTSLDQHPVNQDVWYYTSGEYIGSSASGANRTATYFGTGIFRSTDNGETWNRIPSTNDQNTIFNSQFDFMSRIRIHPSGTVYVASNGFGILRSTDGNDFSDVALGGPGFHAYADVAIASNGDILAVLSSLDALGGTATNNPGIFYSDDNGQNWTEVTPPTFPSEHGRSVLAFAPSNPDIAYVLTQKVDDPTHQGISFHYLNLSNVQSGTIISEDRSANIPDFRVNDEGTGWMNLQGGYNMEVAVHPNDPNYVFVGGTNLFRSDDGFATAPATFDISNDAQVDEYWIGGYAQDNTPAAYGSNMPASDNHHPDQHIIVFDPNNPNRMWTGHDGGLSVTDNVMAQEVHWVDKNSGYIVTQFYTSAIPAQAGDNRLMGGTQDNGTPFFRVGPGGSANESISSIDISSGDGAYAFFTQNHIFASVYRGQIIRWEESETGDIAGPFSYVFPAGAENQLFIHPYTIDPNNEDLLYYPDGNQLWRTTEATSLSNGSAEGATSGFDNLTGASMPNGYTISALDVTQAPSNILYYAGSSSTGQPLIYKLENASNNTSPEDISIDNAPGGAWVKDIVINPINGNEMLAIMSNYNIVGIYHTQNGGESWSSVEGNLTGNPTNPGPSIRSGAIIPSEEGIIYVLGTSTGIYTTALLNGSSTVWGQVATETVGYAVTDWLDARVSDGDIAAGTHGRGMFWGDFQGNTDAPFVLAEPLEAAAGETITLIARDFRFNPNTAENNVAFGDIAAEVLSVSSDSTRLQVRVPRGVIDPMAQNNTVTITVTTNGQSISTNFTILPPNNFTVNQNYPNPFSPSTTIPFDLPVDSRVTLNIYNIAGQRVMQPLRGTEFNAGTYNYRVDFSSLASGVYIYRVVAKAQSGDEQTFVDSRKLTLIK